MLRVIGLTLVVVTGAAKVAHAENRFDRPAANGIETAQQHSPTGAHDQGVLLQIGGGLAFAPAGQDNRGSGHLDLARIERQQRGREGRRLVRSRNAHGRSEGWLNHGASSKPTLAYSVNDSLSFGLDYQYQDGETMNFKVAKVGGLESNYHSHNFMIEAHLEF
jgi:hypothetical protein